MSEEIFIHRYELVSRMPLNSRSERRIHEGALIKFGDDFDRVGCIHPWPELGDAPLAEQLDKLKRGESTPLIEQAKKCAETPQNFDGLTIPRSHFTAVDPTAEDPSAIFDAGFRSVKLKGHGARLDSLAAESRRWIDAGFRLRIDFNETAVAAAIADFWENFPDRDAVDFLEDPVPWDVEDWNFLKSFGIPLAADRDLHLPEKAALAGWWVVKPAVIDAEKVIPAGHAAGKKIIVTSYMDHVVGQLWAAFCAAQFSKFLAGDCGLLTHLLFEPTDFFDAVAGQGPTLTPPRMISQPLRALFD